MLARQDQKHLHFFLFIFWPLSALILTQIFFFFVTLYIKKDLAVRPTLCLFLQFCECYNVQISCCIHVPGNLWVIAIY